MNGVVADQFRIVGLLVARELRTRFSDSRIGSAMNFIEPALQFLVIFLIFALMGRRSHFGTSVFLFLATGFVPYMLFASISGAASRGIRMARGFRHIRIIMPLHVVVAQGMFEFFTHLLIYILAFFLLWFAGISDAIPIYPEAAFAALAAGVALAFGIGLINANVTALFPMWRIIYGLITRFLMLTSGVFYVPDFLPPQYRWYLSWNPLLHVIDWFRTGFYMTYPTNILDRSYLLAWVAVTIFFGLVLERALRRRIAV
jgi:capsular polysaccharide transport system permease protein